MKDVGYDEWRVREPEDRPATLEEIVESDPPLVLDRIAAGLRDTLIRKPLWKPDRRFVHDICELLENYNRTGMASSVAALMDEFVAVRDYVMDQ